jgi:hypothetical protein
VVSPIGVKDRETLQERGRKEENPTVDLLDRLAKTLRCTVPNQAPPKPK